MRYCKECGKAYKGISQKICNQRTSLGPCNGTIPPEVKKPVDIAVVNAIKSDYVKKVKAR